ncbi:hypothetical protein [Achromobacter dolens]|uniref:hypothetical protein n=1 Tax=Achromobacter dolens TaxID=1287738 RepID=UPI003B96946E
MTQPLTTVRLYGRLGAEFGRLHRLAVSTTAEAVRALRVLLPGLEARLRASEPRPTSHTAYARSGRPGGHSRRAQQDFPEP